MLKFGIMKKEEPIQRHMANIEERMKKKINGKLVMDVTGLKSGLMLGDIIKIVRNWIFDAGIDNVSDEDVVNKIKSVKSELDNA